MKSNRRIKKNIKLNTSSYQNRSQSGDMAQLFADRIMIALLAIATPMLSIFGALNLIFRIPDFYNYEFGRVEVSKNLNLEISDGELSDYFSQFMMHKHETMDLLTKYEGSQRLLFSDAESQVMESFRAILDIFLIISIVTLLMVIVIIAILRFNRMAKELRRSMNIGIIIYLVFIAGAILYFNFAGGDLLLMGQLGSSGFGPDDLLQRMFSDRFTLAVSVIVTAVSLIIMMVIRYTVWKITAQKGIFSEALKGINR